MGLNGGIGDLNIGQTKKITIHMSKSSSFTHIYGVTAMFVNIIF